MTTIDTQLVADTGGMALWPRLRTNIAQGSAVFAYYLMEPS